MEHIGARIKRQRELLGWTQEELSEKMQYKSRTTIAKIETGVCDVSLGNIIKFSEVLGVSIPYLLSLNENDNESIQINKSFWLSEFGTVDFTEEEMKQIIGFAKFVLSQRK